MPVTFFQGQPHICQQSAELARSGKTSWRKSEPSFWFRVGMRRARPCHLRHVDALELSNNLAENSMRPVALGRRNWMYIGSEQAGPRVAAIVSVIETCRRLKISIREYLCSILPGFANFPINRVAALTPRAWRARN